MRKRSAGDLIDGKYRLERHLACGGMGEVWAARNLQLDVPVALKLMSAHALASADLVARFEREAKAAAQLRHANVVTVHEHGVFEGVPFMAMELLEGEDLAARLKRCGRLSHAEALPIVTAICKALRRAHEMGIVHRDLKPANVFLARQDEDEIVKVLDFGIAKLIHGVLGAAATRAGTIMGSVFYMAPEQANHHGVKVDHRADLWALGVIAFRMLTGKLPFFGEPEVSVIVRICSEAPPAASSIAPDLDARADAFFARALGRRPDDRFQSAKEIAAAFAALGDPAQACLPAQSDPGHARSTPMPHPRVASGQDHASPGQSPVMASSQERPSQGQNLVRPGRRLGQPAPAEGSPADQHAGTAFVQPAARQETPLRAPVGENPGTVYVQPAARQETPLRAPVGENPGTVYVQPAAPRETRPRTPPRDLVGPSNGGVLPAAMTPGPNTAIVVGAVVAAVLAVAVVGWTVFSSAASPESVPHVR